MFARLLHNARRVFARNSQNTPHAFLCGSSPGFKKLLTELKGAGPDFLGLVHEVMGLARRIKGPLMIG